MGKDEALENTEDIENSNLAEIMVSSSCGPLYSTVSTLVSGHFMTS